jgi:predicted enzyme related to lactoylglutathione lyase
MSDRLFKRLVYIYIGTSNYDADYNFYKNVLGAELLWKFAEFGAQVAAFNLCGEPYLLIADHVQAPSKRLLYEVENIRDAARQLKARGWKSDGREFELPDGPCINFKDASGNEYGILEMKRPYALQKEFAKRKQS